MPISNGQGNGGTGGGSGNTGSGGGGGGNGGGTGSNSGIIGTNTVNTPFRPVIPQTTTRFQPVIRKKTASTNLQIIPIHLMFQFCSTENRKSVLEYFCVYNRDNRIP